MLNPAIARESSQSMRRISMPASAADSPRRSFYGGNTPMPGSLQRTAISNSRQSLSARSTTQSLPGIRSDYNIVESFGQALPVAVNESLTFVGPQSNSVSAKITQKGWAWVVQGRRLLIWQYKDTLNPQRTDSPPRLGKTVRRGGPTAQCRELTLPFSDIGHKSELVTVFQVEGQQMASCIAISATGDVRYWASIAHDNNSVDLSILTGQEFVQLLNLPTQQGYLAVTTTCTLVFLRIGLTNGRHSLHHKTIKPASSFLTGVGKRFASMLFGVNSGGDKDQSLVGMCCESMAEEGETVVAVLSDRALQRWRLTNKGNTEQLIYEDVELMHKIREMILLKFWNVRMPNDNVELELHYLDFQMAKDLSYILVGAVNQAHTPQMYYAIVVARAGEESMQLECFTPLKLNKFFSSKTMQDCLSVRIIVGHSHMYLYTPKVIYPLLLSNAAPTAEIDAEKIEFHLHDDRILSAAICNQLPLFFSRTHGLICVTPGDFDSTDLLNMSNCNTPDLFGPASMNASFSAQDQSMISESSTNLPIYQLDPEEVYTDFSNEAGQLKAAFLYRLRRNNNMVKTVISDLMENLNEPDPNGGPLDVYKLDRLVITIAEDLADDLPTADPRWQSVIDEYGGNRFPLGSSNSMQIFNQLRDKNASLHHFVEFLHFSGLWDKLNAIPCGSNVLKPTGSILAELSEKIAGATALRCLQVKMPKIIDEAIEATVAQWGDKPTGTLTSQDLFYVKLCKFECIFGSLTEIADYRISAQQQSTASVAQYISEINTVVIGVLNHVFRHRQQYANTFKSNHSNVHENQPWTATSGSGEMLDSLLHFIDITSRFGIQSVKDTDLSHLLYQQLVDLIDMLLDARKNYLDSVRDTEKFQVLQQQFESQRSELISILIKDRQYEYAAKLAEKFLDFQSLVLICDETQDKQRLDEYTHKYEEFDFSKFAINWHLRQNRHGEVFERFKGNQNALSQFTRDHPSLGWVQLMLNGDFDRSSKVLLDLAQCESEFVARKKTMLSLSKLAAYAESSDLVGHLEKVDNELTVIEYQANLGHDVLQNFGFDPADQKVLKPEEIINLFIADENESANEFEFRKALDLLSYVDHPYDMRHKIWCAAIRRDNWTDYDANNATYYVQKLIFYKIVEISQIMDTEADSLLPPMEDFLASNELGDLPQKESFQYLLKLTYEHVAEMFKRSDDMDL